MVGYPVEPHLHSQTMCLCDKGSQVGNGTIFRVGLLEVCGSIGAVDASASGVDGHEPDDVDAKGPEFPQSGLGCCEGPFGGERADVHLIDDAPSFSPFLCRAVDLIDVIRRYAEC